MNKRIQELMEQADLHAPGGKWKEYFAELIVRECGEVATKFAIEWCRHGEMPDYGYERVIKEHFGVE